MTNIQFQLDPAIPYINVMATQGWFYVQYPSGLSYWSLQDSNGQQLMTGNYTFSQEVLSQWTTSDQVLIDALLAASPWDINDTPAPEPVIEAPAVEAAPVEETSTGEEPTN